ncbi:hypothetical protein [Chitinophaga sp. GbtcB8]|uniref:hypothetical protein n=1 Tax=Chitinophaga sp. GbtcB8 TaxID=2824753 RepID=UPI001C2FF2DE|nr:hypothetical protein [Chitinophaga sp. GbtcB8]
MMESMFIIPAEELVDGHIQGEPIDFSKIFTPPSYLPNLVFKGFVVCPSLDEAKEPVFYLNAVFFDPQAKKDVIVQNDRAKGCPYPPGYATPLH